MNENDRRDCKMIQTSMAISGFDIPLAVIEERHETFLKSGEPEKIQARWEKAKEIALARKTSEALVYRQLLEEEASGR